MMKLPHRFLPAVLVAAVVAPVPVAAHSLESLETELRGKEKFLEIRNVPSPDFALQDADGKPVQWADRRGLVVVLHFVYASCADVCPRHADSVARIQEMVNQTPMRDQVRFVTITTDPERDTPDVLRAYGDVHGLDPVNWAFLTSGIERPAATRELAEGFGHKFTVTEDGEQMHGVVTHVLDRKGMLRANFHGLEFDPTNLVVYLNGLVNEAAPHGHDETEFPDDSVWGWPQSLF